LKDGGSLGRRRDMTRFLPVNLFPQLARFSSFSGVARITYNLQCVLRYKLPCVLMYKVHCSLTYIFSMQPNV
jgi:hypothetical protein